MYKSTFKKSGAKYIEWGRFFPRSFSEARKSKQTFVPHGSRREAPVNPNFAPLFPKVDFPKVDF